MRLERVFGAQAFQRVERARDLLRLLDLARAIAPREWCTIAEYEAALCSSAQADGSRRSRWRLRKWFAELGLRLRSTRDLEGLWRVYVAASEVVDLLELHERDARAIVERSEARREGRNPEPLEDAPAAPADMEWDYRVRRRSVRWIRKRYELGDQVVRVVLGFKLAMRPALKPRIEDRRSLERQHEALELHDVGETLEVIAEVLGCCRNTASAFLRRHGREPRPRGRPRTRGSQLPFSEGEPMLRPLNGVVVVRRAKPPAKSEGGIELLEGEPPLEGLVVAAGPGRSLEGGVAPMPVRPGERVIFGRHAGVTTHIDGEDLVFMDEREILAVREPGGIPDELAEARRLIGSAIDDLVHVGSDVPESLNQAYEKLAKMRA